MKVGDMKTWKEHTIGVRQLARLLFNNNFIDPGLVLNSWDYGGKQELLAFYISFAILYTQIDPSAN